MLPVAMASQPCFQCTMALATLIRKMVGMAMMRVKRPRAMQMQPSTSVPAARKASRVGNGRLSPPSETGAPNQATVPAKPITLEWAPT